MQVLPQGTLPASRMRKYRSWEYIHSVLWKGQTLLIKRWISIQDRFGLFTYDGWLRRMEKEWLAKSIPLSNLLLNECPLINIIVSRNCPEMGTDELAASLGSLSLQTYPRWEALIEADLQPDHITKNFEEDGRIRWHPGDSVINGNIRDLINSLSGEWVLFLSPGTRLSPIFLQSAISSINANQDVDLIYWDEDQVDQDGAHHSPWFKPDWSPELLLSVNYLRNGLFRLKKTDDIRPEAYNSLEDFIFLSTETVRRVIHIPQVLIHNSHNKGREIDCETCEERMNSIRKHLERTISSGSNVYIDRQRVRVSWPVQKQLASIIIPTRDNLELIRRCVRSILDRTESADFEILLIDTGSREPQTFEFYQELKKYPQVHIHSYDGQFNYSRANNYGANLAKGEVFVFLNNDIEVINSDWLGELVLWASNPGVAIVGGKLIYPDQTIQHAGIILGLEGHASHIFYHTPEGTTGLYGSTEWYRDFSAVTGACLAIRRDIFFEIGGFDEDYRLVFSDIEICLKAKEHNYRVVYNPFARLIHHEGKTRGKTMPGKDISIGADRLRSYIMVGDPYFNGNLSLSSRIPTLRRTFEEDPVRRLDEIARWLG